MPLIHENPTYFTDNSVVTSSLNGSSGSRQQQHHHHNHQPKHSKYGSGSSSHNNNSSFAARRKLSSVTSYEDTEDGSELDTFLSSCESNNSFDGSENRILPISTHNNNGSLRRKGGYIGTLPLSPSAKQQPNPKPSTSSSTSSLSRFGQLFKKSKSKLSVQSGGSCASTVDSSGIGSPTTCTPDSSLSIYTNSLDGDSHSSTNSNQISPKNTNSNQLEESTMEDRFCSSYTFDDCGIFAANMYYNVGESSVFTIYNTNGRQKGSSICANTHPQRDDDDEFKDCVKAYYNNPTFSTFPNPKRCSVASAASTSTSSVVPVPLPLNENRRDVPVVVAANGNNSSVTIQHDRDGYLRPNEPQTGSRSNLRNVKNLYINDSIIENEKNNGQVREVQVDVHTPTTPGPSSLKLVNCSSSSSGGGGFGGSAGSRLAYHFDSAGSTTSAATTLVAGGSHNFSNERLPEIDGVGNNSGGVGRRNNGQLPVYMNRAYFGSNSISSSSLPLHSSAKGGSPHRVIAPPTFTSVAADCEPYCSLCASLVMGSPRQRSKMDVAIVKCRECFFSREAESHIRGFFDKLMTEDKQKMDVTLKSYDLKDLDHPSDRVVVHCAKVQIVIISHHFLQRLKDEASRRPRLSPINRVFRSKNVIAVLLAVSAQEVTEGYEAVLPRFSEWFSVDLRSTNKSDPDFCKKFTEQVVRIYNVELSNSSNFSVFPKKVTREQPKICIVFKKPVNQDDEVRVELRTQRELRVVQNVKLDNPHTLMLRVPDSLSPDREAIVDVSVFVNNNKIGGSRIKSELNLRRMDDDDLDRMAKLLPPFMEWLDKHISETLMKHYKDCTDYTVDPALELMNGIIICKADILPTIMHFAAFYGLPQTAFTVLDEADGLAHCTVKNELDETPSDIAFTRGHSRIGNMIGDYQEISNSYTAYRYIKDIVDKNTEPGALALESFSLDQVGNGSSTAENGASENRAPVIEKPPQEIIAEEESAPASGEDTASNTEGPPSEPSSGTKSEDDADRLEGKKAPTPLTRRRINKVENRRLYINVDRNPEDNPEIVQKREKGGGSQKKVPDVVRNKRHSIMQTYDMPRTQDQDYSVPPSDVRPVVVQSDVSTVCQSPSNSPVFRRKNAGPVETSSGYLIMNDGIGEMITEAEKPLTPPSLPQAPNETSEISARKISTHNQNQNHPDQLREPPMANSKDSSPTPSSSSSNERCRTGTHTIFKPPPSKSNNTGNAIALDPSDEQLIDLMNAFKDKTYDMHMVELLFESWKQRPDVQRSIEDKKEMLDKWREEYREQRAKGGRKQSTLDKIRSVWSRRKKSQVTTEVIYPTPVGASQNSSASVTVTSPTGLTFTGPTLPTQTFSTSLPSSPPPILSPSHNQPRTPNTPNFEHRISESSYRTSIDSRYSESSAESDKLPVGESASTMNRVLPAKSSPPEYHNPMSKRFIPQYITPTLAEPRLPPRASPEAVSTSVPLTPSAEASYEVPPPPRPVKQLKKPAEEPTVQASPKPPRKPPLVPGSNQLSSKAPKKPPTVPAKPNKKYLDTESNSPPPVPPPRSNNASPNMFNFIDYRKKNEEMKPNDSSEKPKTSYENMNAEVEMEVAET